MATCVILGVRQVQKRKRQRRAMELGLDMDERRFKRRLEAAVAEVDDIFADDDDEDEDALEDEGLTGAEREQLKLLEAEAAKTPARGGGAAATPAPSGGKKASKGSGGGAGVQQHGGGDVEAPATPATGKR